MPSGMGGNVIDVAQNYAVGYPIQASTYAHRVDAAMNVLHIGMLVIFVVWSAFFIYCLVRFRRRPGQEKASGSFKYMMVAFLPVLCVLGFELWLDYRYGIPVWAHIKEEFPEESKSLVVQMVAEQFSWGFQYAGPDGKFGKRDPKLMAIGNPMGVDSTDPAAADDIVTRNQLHIPMGKPAILYMTSKDVIHSFFVPEFRTKQDVVPGMQTRIWFEPTKVGGYEIGCAQLCGTGHYAMRGEVIVDTPEDFEAWQQKMRAAKAQASPPAPMAAW